MRYQLRVRSEAPAASGVVVVSLAADVLVAVAKTAAAALTRSTSLAAEAVHSWVDTGVGFFMLAAARTGGRPADKSHPLGYGRVSFVWSLFASIWMLSLGSILAIWQGIAQIRHGGEAGTGYFIGYTIIGISFILESISFLQVLHRVRTRAKERSQGIFAHVLQTSDSTLSSVFAADLAALVSLVVAALGMALRQVTGLTEYDSAGAITIGVLMGTVALVLINKNRGFLEGKSIDPKLRAEALQLLRSAPEVSRVTYLHTEFIGPDRVLFVAGVQIAGEHSQIELAHLLKALEDRIIDEHDKVGIAVLTLATPEEEDARS